LPLHDSLEPEDDGVYRQVIRVSELRFKKNQTVGRYTVWVILFGRIGLFENQPGLFGKLAVSLKPGACFFP
jgi:hypothetical protein